MSANALQASVIARLEATPAVIAITGAGRIFDRLITRAEPPYLVIGEFTTTDFSTGDATGSEHHFEIQAWSKHNGRKQAVDLADAVRTALHDADLTLAGAVLINLRHERTVSRRAQKTALHVARLRFRAVTEP